MFETSSLPLRLVFVFAAVVSFGICSDAARASPITTQVDNGAGYTVLRPSHTPYSHYRLLFTGLPSDETGIQTGTNGESEPSGSYRRVSSIIDRQSNLPRVTKRRFIHNQSVPDNGESGAGITRVQSGAMPAGHSQRRGQSLERSRVNDLPLTRRAAPSRNSAIVRKSSHKEAAGPFHHTYRLSRDRDRAGAQRSLDGPNAHRKDSPKAAEHKSVWQPSASSPFSSQTGRYWSVSLPTSRRQHGGYKDTNELAAVGPWSTSSRIQSTKRLGLASQIAPRSPSVNSVDATAVKHYPRPVKSPSSITGFLRGQPSVSSGETPRHEKVKSYLFNDARTSFDGRETVNAVTADGDRAFYQRRHEQKSSDSRVYGRFPSDFKRLQKSQREESSEEVRKLVGVNQDNVNGARPMYHNANVAQYGAQTDSLTQYQHMMERFILSPHVDLQGKEAIGRKEPVESRPVNTAAGGSGRAHKTGQTTKSIYGFRGFKSPAWRGVKETSTERMNSPQHGYDEGNVYPPSSPKLSSGQSEASTTSAKREKTPTDYSSSSPGVLVDVKSVNPPRPLTSGLMEARRQIRIYRGISGLKGLDPEPREGVRPLDHEPDKSDRVQQGFQGFKISSSQIWPAASNRIHKRYNKTDPGGSRESTSSQNEPSSQDLKTRLLKTEGSHDTVSTSPPDEYEKDGSIFTQLGFHPVYRRLGDAANRARWEDNEYSGGQRVSPTYLRSSPESKPSAPSKTESIVAKSSRQSGSSTVRGKRVRGKHAGDKRLNKSVSLTKNDGSQGIVRLPKRPATDRPASFSGVRATTKTPTAPAEERPPNATATTEQTDGAGHWALNPEDPDRSRSPEAHREENNKDTDINTTELLPENEGSGGGSFNASDVSSRDATDQRLSEDLLELDYLRVATGNISFRSMKLSRSEG